MSGDVAEVTVQLVDVEPVAGLFAASARLCVALSPDVIAIMSDDARDALMTMQSLLWSVEHSKPERIT